MSGADADLVIGIVTGTFGIEQGSLYPADHLLGDRITLLSLACDHRLPIAEGDKHEACELTLLVQVLLKGFLNQLTQEQSSSLRAPELAANDDVAQSQHGECSRALGQRQGANLQPLLALAHLDAHACSVRQLR